MKQYAVELWRRAKRALLTARDMLAADPDLRREFETRLASDSAFAANVRARRHFFYRRTPYYEAGFNWYPVARLMGSELPPAALWEEN